MFMGAMLILYPEGTTVRGNPAGSLSTIEHEVIAEIRALRASAGSGLFVRLLGNPAQLAHHFILDSHGNVQLRFSTIASELGVEMRTLERAFVGEYRMTMTQFQVEVRLAFSQLLLSVFPPTKVSAIAALLGYHLVQDFNRFFKKHMRQSPSEWSRKERAKIARAERATKRD
jgi:AraC-like DNA-binding protein